MQTKPQTRGIGWFTSLALVIAFVSAFFQLRKHSELYIDYARRFEDNFGVTSSTKVRASSHNGTKETLESYQCQPYAPSTVLLSSDPLILHVHNFVTPFEREHLISIAEERFLPSTVGPGEEREVQLDTRVSESALLPDVVGKNASVDPVISCVLRKASELQGFVPISHTEPLQVLRYSPGGFYKSHVDPFPSNDPKVDGNRASSIFVILKSVGLLGTGMGGTSFVNLERPAGHESGLCEIVECGDDVEGLAWKPIEGSAVFWKNLQDDGSIHWGTLHTGVKVPDSGEKIGMNLWTWNKPYGYADASSETSETSETSDGLEIEASEVIQDQV